MEMSSTIDHANIDLPDIDERLVAPQTDYEIDDGKLVRVSPCDEPHAIRHSLISALVEAHAADDMVVASDMLMRLSETSDRAPDVSVFPRARDPRTGKRQIDQLAFEVVNTESLSEAAKKARDLHRRGVRRVFAVDVEHLRAFEWSPELGTWALLDPASSIEDRCLAVALPIEDLVHAAKADNAVARALLAKRNPVLVAALAEVEAKARIEGEAKGRIEGEAKGRTQAILLLLTQRGLDPTVEQRDRIVGERDLAQLDHWLARAVSCATVAELFK